MADKRTLQAFNDAVTNLESDARSYDESDPFDLAGRWRLAKRMTGEIWLIAITHRRNQTSLIDTLGLTDRAHIPSCAGNGGIHGAPLLHLCLDPVKKMAVFTAPRVIDDAMPKLSATDWLKEEIYRSETFGLTRFDVLKTIRNKEGVGHFDAKINQASGYSALRNAGHEDCYWRRCKDRGCIALFIFGTPFYSVAVAPPDGTPPPPLESKKHPLLGGVDGSVRTMAEELMCWLRSYGAIPAQKARDSQKLRTPFNNRLNVVRTSQPSDRQKPFAAKLGVIH